MVALPLQLKVHIFPNDKIATEDDMSKPESVSDLHRIGGFVNDQHDGRKDQPITGADLYNVAVQLDSNFASLRSDIGNLRTEMYAEFKSVAAEFKSVRAEMAEGFAIMNLRFADLGKDISRTNWKVAGSAIVAMIALLGIDRFWQ